MHSILHPCPADERCDLRDSIRVNYLAIGELVQNSPLPE